MKYAPACNKEGIFHQSGDGLSRPDRGAAKLSPFLRMNMTNNGRMQHNLGLRKSDQGEDEAIVRWMSKLDELRHETNAMHSARPSHKLA